MALNPGPGGAKDVIENAKATIERIRGRRLTWDEFFLVLMTEYVDLPAEKQLTTEVRVQITALEDLLRKNRETRAADCVEIFADALVSVISGKLSDRALYAGILDAGDD